MNALTQAIYDVLAGDTTLTGLLTPYHHLPGVFTAFPVPEKAEVPYVVSAGDVVDLPWDTKNSRGREITRDIRAFALADGNPIPVEVIGERVRFLFHRRTLPIQGYNWVISGVTGPIAADGDGYYGRVVTLTVKAQEA